MTSVHLLVLVHGMWGNPDHLAEMARIARETFDTPQDGVELRVLIAETNREDCTYDGIDWGGERVAQEVFDEIEKIKDEGLAVTRFSVTGYSLGGLVARYVIGILHQRKFFETVTPVNFNTVATPHVGLPRYPSFFSSVASSLGPKLLSRTGEQFYCADNWASSGRPLLVVMADPERIFYKAWSLFSNTTIYANAVHDTTVPYVTAAIELEDPFLREEENGLEIELDDKYNALIKKWSLPPAPPASPPRPRVLSREWFKYRKTKKSRPLLPPLLQFRFPFNLVFYTTLPFLIPIVIGLVFVRFSLASRSSRARIRLLETTSKESKQERLIHVVEQLEQDVGDAVADLVESPLSTTPSTPSEEIQNPSDNPSDSKVQPILTTNQRQIVAWLNSMPKLKKQLAYFTGLRNSHATIVSRDVKRFEAHKRGEPVIRHWAEHLII